MGPALFVLLGVRFENTAQVCLTEHDHVIETFATNRSNGALSMTGERGAVG